ncbi:MAG TPA: glycosyltransferase family 4 protein [Stellaceae bacterium]|nr:glycosyltransferase family 4 protein [Stellaceae bacterium]
MRLFGGRRVRIAVVASVVARYDAISLAVRDIARTFRDTGRFEVEVLAPRCDFFELRAHEVQDAAALEAHRAYRSADVRIFAFGVFSPLFDAVAHGDGRVPHIVQFHNVTPPEFVAPQQRALVERSLRQLGTFRQVDRFWAVSPTNADDLIARGIARERIEVIPLAVDRPAAAAIAHKPALPVRLLFLGRLVPSKGPQDLIEAIDLARRRTTIPFQLDIAGNEEYSDPAHVAAVKAAVIQRGLSSVVRFAGAVADARLDELFHAAHLLVIPSYHEGFCRPVIEGLRAGSIPVGYAAYNLPVIARGLGRMVPTGDRAALAAALVELISTLGAGGSRHLRLDGGTLDLAAFDRAAQDYAKEFAPERVAARMVRSVQALLSR